MATSLIGLGNVVARHRAAQSDIARFVVRAIEAHLSERDREEAVRLTRAVFSRGGIETRCSVLPDFACDSPAEHTFFPKNRELEPLPTTAARMRVFEVESVELAKRAGELALRNARVEAREISHLVVTTCTGFFAPGPDVALIEALALPRSVARTIVGFMGCYAGFTGVRLADQIVRAEPDAVVLVVSVELCSLHFRPPRSAEEIVATSLFADGASAGVYARAGARRRARAEIVATSSFVAPGSEREMSWRIGDHGFEMTLAAEVPKSLAAHAPQFVDALFERARVTRGADTRFGIHPGGKRIIDAIAGAIDLRADDVASAREVLREHGNMSSAAIGFVLEHELERSEGEHDLVLLGFGPGLTMEGAVLRTR